MGSLADLSAEMLIQAGFAGFSFILLCILVWLLKRFIELQRQSIKALGENTEAVNETRQAIKDVQDTTSDIRDKLQSRPCIAKHE